MFDEVDRKGRTAPTWRRERCAMTLFVHLSGIEPPHMAPEAIALSTELQMRFEQGTFYYSATQKSSLVFRNCVLKKRALSDIITLYVYL